MNSVTIESKGYYDPKLFVIEQWCRDNIGPGGQVTHSCDLWSVYKSQDYTKFNFKDENDFTSFVLRWGFPK